MDSLEIVGKINNGQPRLTEKYKDKPNNATLAMREILKNATRYNLSYKFGRKKL